MEKVTYNGKEYELLDAGTEEALKLNGTYVFFYYPQDRLLIGTDSFMEYFKCPRFFPNIPYSLQNSFVNPMFIDNLLDLADHINRGEKSYSALMGSKIRTMLSRVTLTTVLYDESGKKPIRSIGTIQRLSDELDKSEEYANKVKVVMDSQAETIAITDALTAEYESVYILDIENNVVKPIRLSAAIEKAYGPFFRSGPTYEQAFGAYVERTVFEDDKQMLLERATLGNMLDELKTKKLFEQEYRVKRDGILKYFKMKVAKQVIESSGKTYVIFGFGDVNEQKLRWEKLLSNSLTDELTGIGNRRAYEERMNQFNNIVPSEGLGFISVDANNLKGINDSLGHAAGDEMLAGLAECLIDAFGHDNCFRMGGDEFYVILTGTKIDIEEKIEKFKLNLIDWHGIIAKGVSAAYGLAHSIDYPLTTPINLSRIADDRMYRNKESYYVQNGMTMR